MKNYKILFFLILFVIHETSSIHIPGVSPEEFKIGDKLDVRAIKLSSKKTQLPYDYYELSFCHPKDNVDYIPQSIGEILVGDRLVNTPYEIFMKQDESCKILCENKLSVGDWKGFNYFIDEEYNVNLLIDNLPATTLYQTKNTKVYDYGFRVGKVDMGKHQIFNHLEFNLKYHKNEEKYLFVGFEVKPISIGNSDHGVNGQCSTERSFKPLLEDSDKIVHSYSVKWTASEIRWASRWDIYLKNTNSQIHWLSIMNSILVVLLLTGLLAMIMIRILRRDISRYNKLDDTEDILEESGWKLVHGDVFRPPRFGKIFAAFIGSGVQLFCMVTIILIFATLGAISPAKRGSYITAAVFSYNFMGLFAGFFAGKIYVMIRGKFWKSTAIITGVLYPAFIFMVGIFMNFFLWSVGSSSAIPFSTIFAMLSLWCLVSIPLVYIGFYIGYRRKPLENPVRTNQIPRALPNQRWGSNFLFLSLIGGAMPFGAMSVELFFLMSAIWNRQVFYLFGFLFIVFIIFTICCGQISIFMIYFQLCNEDYNWWWRSIFIPGGTSIYVFIYTIYYLYTQLTIQGIIPAVIYLGYSTIISSSIFLLSGTIGFFASYTFVRKIYSSIKVD